jgi:CRP-like cAMP-binding protein
MESRAVPKGTRSGNELIDRVGKEVREAFLREARRMSLAHDAQLLSQGESVRRVYFPVTAVLSLTVGLSSGERSEYCTVGCEGLVGVSALLDRESLGYVTVQIPGDAWVMEAGAFRRLRDRHAALGEAVFGFVLYAMRFAAQAGLCNSFHSIDQRLARWLLTVHDRLSADEVHLTQESLASMLAASRPRVSEAAHRLRAVGLIEYHSSRLRIVDRRGLEAVACECYARTRLP